MTSDSVASDADASALPPPQSQPEYNRVATLVVAASVGITTMSFNCWWPFLPLYARELGARSDVCATRRGGRGCEERRWFGVAETGAVQSELPVLAGDPALHVHLRPQNASRARRGTAFGIASSAQAISFAIGPIGAAVFAAVSLEAGFIALAVMLVALAALVRLKLREPDL